MTSGEAESRPEIWDALAAELAAAPGGTLRDWRIPGGWRAAKLDMRRLVFGPGALPDRERPARVEAALSRAAEQEEKQERNRRNGGAPPPGNGVPQLTEVILALSGVYRSRPFTLRDPGGR